MQPPPGAGSPFYLVSPSDPNQYLSAVKVAWDQLNALVNGGLASGWNDLAEIKQLGDAYFFPGPNL